MKVVAVILIAATLAGCGLVREVSHWVDDTFSCRRSEPIEQPKVVKRKVGS